MATTPAELTGLFKEVYGDDIINLIPEAAKFTRRVKFTEKSKETGNLYHQPVVVSQEHGVTYASPTSGAFALKAAVAMNTQDAQIRGNQMLLRSSLSYDAAAKASNSKKAFREATELLVTNMMESMTKRLEIAEFYGHGAGTAAITNTGLGTCVAGAIVDINATSHTLPISAASWATGIWSGLENAKLNFYYNNAGTLTLISSGANAIFEVDSVDTDAKTVTISGTATGISDLETRNDTDDVIAFFDGAFGNEFAGMNTIIRNTGLLFNVNATTYGLWRGNVSTVTGAITLGKVSSAVAKAVNRGLNEKVAAYLSPDAFATLANDQAALRQYDQSKGPKASNGFESIELLMQSGVVVEFISHNIVKGADCFILPENKAKRLGAQDVSFKTPGRGEDLFLHLPDNAGFELRLYTDQCLLLEQPARTVVLNGFTA
jgi:hypothetical protein